MLDGSFKIKANKIYSMTYSPATGSNAYLQGATDFQKRAIEELGAHIQKADIHDEFDTEKSKEYFKAINNAISIIKTLKA